MEGATREEAFRIGKEIADAVTASNPSPIKLQFEKVYHPSVLITKKRYVGYKYESPNQKEPIFEAKGIETVRRDTCPAVAKILEKSIRLLFEEKDLSSVKKYLQLQWSKILVERVSLQDFIFAKEVRLGSYSEKGMPPPAAVVSIKRMNSDPRAEPRYGERVPYVVVMGEPNSRLVDLVISPELYISNPNKYKLNSTYYILKQIIPALGRVFSLVGVDVSKWFAEMPKKGIRNTRNWRANNSDVQRTTLDHYYRSQHCPLCDKLTTNTLCSECGADPQRSMLVLTTRAKLYQRELEQLVDICMMCGHSAHIHCEAIDCSVLFRKLKLTELVKSHTELLW